MQQSFYFVITMMTIAANLGSMLTPIGNPQNLYLYSISGASLWEFVKIMLPYTLLAGIMLAAGLFVFCGKKEIILPADKEQSGLNIRKLCYYLMLFFISLLTVAGLFGAEYIDVHTLLILFCLMAVVAGLRESGLFQWMGDTLLKRIHSERGLAFVLVFLRFFSSMLITNDVALITLCRLRYFF